LRVLWEMELAVLRELHVGCMEARKLGSLQEVASLGMLRVMDKESKLMILDVGM